MWVARNKDGSLELFEGKPLREEEHWSYYCIYSVVRPHTKQHFSSKILNTDLFPELKWEDEPIEVELTKTTKVLNIGINNGDIIII